VRVTTLRRSATGQNEVDFLDDTVHPPIPVTPMRRILVQPHHMQHACEYCFVASAALMMCGKCKTAHYCNAECQRADWARHKVTDCAVSVMM